MKVAVPRETAAGERRVALTPDAAAGLVKSGLEVLVETGAGDGAFHADAAFEKAGARIVPDAATLYGQADVVLKVQKPTLERGRSCCARGPCWCRSSRRSPAPSSCSGSPPAGSPASAWRGSRASAARRRWTRSRRRRTSPATRRCSSPPSRSPKFFPMLMTAAGTVFAARVLVIGAGVAGLQAIATARRLGAQVWGYDVRAGGEGAGREPRAPSSSSSTSASPTPRTRAATRRRSPPTRRRRQQEHARREDEGVRRRHHDGAGAGPARAAPRHQGDRRRHAARLGDRRPRRRGGRQLRADRARPGGRRGTASPSTARPTCPPRCPCTRASSTRAT